VDLLNSLSKTTIFSHLNEDELRALEDIGIIRHYRNSEWIVYQGDVWPYLFFVARGEVSAAKESVDGRSLILEIIGAGEIFLGLAFFLDDTPMPASLRASQDCELLLWPLERLSPLLMKDGRLSWELSRLILRRALRASSIVDELAFQPLAGRLAKFLIERYGTGGQERISRNITLEEMAAHVGSTREVVCRLLQRFANQGMIEITRKEFMFTDREMLSQLARNFEE
jgi:CRP/FNR family transcriptional regulator